MISKSLPEEIILERLQLKWVNSSRKYRDENFAGRTGSHIILTAWFMGQWPLSLGLQSFRWTVAYSRDGRSLAVYSTALVLHLPQRWLRTW
jgi:hypothetical protein